MKHMVLIVDGASGWPVTSFEGRTSLEQAHTPHLDRLAREGTVGLVHNVPDGMEPSSAIACMSVMGFDPVVYYAGRGPIEATAMGIELEPGQVAMRCNLVTVSDGRLTSYSAGGISSAEAAELIAALREELADERFELYAGVGFRHILTVEDGADLVETTFTAPHDIAGKPVAEFSPVGPGAGLAQDLMERSKAVLEGHPVNKRRLSRGEPAATQIWLFWPGMRPERLPAFAEIYGGRRAALTSAVDLLRGLAIQTGMDVLAIPGVTDGGDNDFAGQMSGALEALAEHDLVFVHVEAPDEASHAGDAPGKVEAIEQVDRLMVPQVMAMAEGVMPPGNAAGPDERSGAGAAATPGGLGLLVLPDHPTPLEIRTHVPEPVPFVMWGPGFAANGTKAYSEAEARATGLAVAPGHLLMQLFLKGRA